MSKTVTSAVGAVRGAGSVLAWLIVGGLMLTRAVTGLPSVASPGDAVPDTAVPAAVSEQQAPDTEDRVPSPLLVAVLMAGRSALARGDPAGAAEAWRAAAVAIDPEAPEAGRLAGWSHVLASAAYAAANRRDAYRSFALGVSALARGGSRWATERERLQRWLAGPATEPATAVVRWLEEVLDLTGYSGPDHGLGEPWWGSSDTSALEGVAADAPERPANHMVDASRPPPAASTPEAQRGAVVEGVAAPGPPLDRDTLDEASTEGIEEGAAARDDTVPIEPSAPPARAYAYGAVEAEELVVSDVAPSATAGGAPVHDPIDPGPSTLSPHALVPDTVGPDGAAWFALDLDVPVALGPDLGDTVEPGSEAPGDQAPIPTTPQAVESHPEAPAPADELARTPATSEVDDLGALEALIDRKADRPAADARPDDTRLVPLPDASDSLDLARLSRADRELAAAAWAYMERNRRANGLVDSVQGYPYLTLWDLGSTLAAIHAAGVLELVPATEAGAWLRMLLETLADLPLYRDELPNREYDARTATMASSGGNKQVEGSGWSALDIGRVLVWLRIVHREHPSLRTLVERVVASWDLRRLRTKDALHGVFFSGVNERLRQEGRLGYEQYAAAGLALWGPPMVDSANYDDIAIGVVDGIEVLYDRRNLPFLTSDPFVLGAIELDGIDDGFRAITDTLFAVQEQRWARTGRITAAGEDALDRPPWFVYNNILYQGKPWHAVSHRGTAVPALFGWSAKGALGWWALHPRSDYGRVLRDAVQELARADRGVRAGRLDTGAVNGSLNINTNAVVLEIMLFVARDGRPFLSSADGEPQ